MSEIRTRAVAVPQSTAVTEVAEMQSAPIVNVNDTSASDRLIEFVEAQIDKMRMYTNLGNGFPTFFELNEALANYSNINCSLISLGVMAKEEYQTAKDAYDEFIAEKYRIVRLENNLPSLSAQKWLSTQEIMLMIQSDNRWIFEYRALRDEMNAAERKMAFCRRLLDNMADFKFNLGVLSKNVQAEVLNLSGARSLGMEQN